MTAPVNLLLNEGRSSLQKNMLDEADKFFSKASSIEPLNDDIYYKIGLIYASYNQLSECKHYFLKAYDLNKNNSDLLYNLGLLFSVEKNTSQALRFYDEALALSPDNIEVLINKSGLLNEIKDFDGAKAAAEKALGLGSTHPETWINHGIALRNLNQPDLSLDSFEKALAISPRSGMAVFNKALSFIAMSMHNEAIQSLDQAIHIQPRHGEAYFYKALCLEKLHSLDMALTTYDQGLLFLPRDPGALVNRGNLLTKLKRHREALISYDQAIDIDPSGVAGWKNKAAALSEIKLYPQARDCYQKAYQLDPQEDYLLGDLLCTQLYLCQWDKYEELHAKLLSALAKHETVSTPFYALGLTDSIALQRNAAEGFVSDFSAKESGNIKPFSTLDKNQKIKIAYLSADFHTHAVAILTAGLFENHDRSIFEVIGLSAGPTRDDEMQLRLKNSFDQFIDVSKLSDPEIASVARELNIEIVIDLGGLTQNSRSGALKNRLAPIQIAYLGYPGTSGADYIDYLIGDHFLIPEKYRGLYSEKIIYLPYCFQVNDDQRFTPINIPNREKYNLPEVGFIFCCFNNSFKITPNIFESWMKILGQVPGSFLWLLADYPETEKNLRNEAGQRGINPDRLLFAPRLPPSQYLERYQAADVFLDTFPFNAGTTASDALWVGLPVLTLSGEAFASRMAGSQLSSLDLPELICESAEQYVERAIFLARHADKLKELRARLSDNKKIRPLFNTKLTTQYIEKAYRIALERYRKGELPTHIDICP